ncbi:hypothetical protein ACHAXA_008441 [Cyclostephanos tholiformis]|uniref:Pre-rRNA-processing protein TSR2 n=1 Tax=Cyclostephanos tholiformis TaxID=382380 RepID=A0ABD3SBT2_9STRA
MMMNDDHDDGMNNNDLPPTINHYYVEFQAGVTAALRSWSALRTAVEQSWGTRMAAEDLRSNIFRHFHDGGGVVGGGAARSIMTRDELEDNLLDYMEDEFGVILEDGSEREIADLICRMHERCGAGDIALARDVVRCAIRAEAAMMGGNGIGGVFRVVDGGGDIRDENDDDDDDDENDVENDDDDDDDDDDDMDEDDDDSGGEGVTANTVDSNPTGSSSYIRASTMMGDATDIISAEAVRAYASGDLFGNGSTSDGPKRKGSPPPRQLGEPEPARPMPALDDDGFAVVPTRRRGGARGNGTR